MFFRHKRKSIVGEAAQFREDGSQDSLIASWFGIHPQRVKETDALSAHTLAGIARRAERGNSKRKTEGDWLIRTKSGGLYICPEKDFAEHYVKVEDFEPKTKGGSPTKHDEERAPFPRLREKKRDAE